MNRKVLYGLGILLIVLGILSWPNNHKLNQAKQNLRETNIEIKKVDHHTKTITEADKDFDLPQSENNASGKLSEGVSLVLGGLHNKEDWNNNKAKIQGDLGNSLTKQLNAYAKDRNSGDYIVSKNDVVSVGFDQTDNPENAKVYITSTFERGNQTSYVLITGNYNLKTGKLTQATVSPLSKQPTTHTGGNN